MTNEHIVQSSCDLQPLVHLSARPSRPRLIQEFPCSWGRNHWAACCERPLTLTKVWHCTSLIQSVPLYQYTFDKKEHPTVKLIKPFGAIRSSPVLSHPTDCLSGSLFSIACCNGTTLSLSWLKSPYWKFRAQCKSYRLGRLRPRYNHATWNPLGATRNSFFQVSTSELWQTCKSSAPQRSCSQIRKASSGMTLIKLSW